MKLLSFRGNLATLVLSIVAVFATSCNKDTYGTYTYSSRYVSTTGIADSTARVEIVNYCRGFEYFQKTHSYTGTYSECYKLAINDFGAAILELDDDFIESRLGEDENFAIYCIETDSGGYIAYKYWTANDEEDSSL